MKYYKDEGSAERYVNDEDLPDIIEEYLYDHAEFDFDEIESGNNLPTNI